MNTPSNLIGRFHTRCIRARFGRAAMLLGLTCAASLAPQTRAQLLLNPGDQWTYRFDSLPRTGSTNAFVATAGGSFEFTIDGGTLQDGDQLVYEMFEGTTLDTPICSGTLAAGSPATLVCSVPGAWQQMQGAIRFRMLAGSVAVDHIKLQAIVSGPSLSSYDVYASSLDPEPGPRLSIALVSGAAQITWPTNFVDHRLEYATNLPPTAWNLVTNPVTTVSDRFSITLEPDAGERVYRLHKP